jgi:hypothetical protein
MPLKGISRGINSSLLTKGPLRVDGGAMKFASTKDRLASFRSSQLALQDGFTLIFKAKLSSGALLFISTRPERRSGNRTKKKFLVLIGINGIKRACVVGKCKNNRDGPRRKFLLGLWYDFTIRFITYPFQSILVFADGKLEKEFRFRERYIKVRKLVKRGPFLYFGKKRANNIAITRMFFIGHHNVTAAMVNEYKIWSEGEYILKFGQ